MNKNYIKKGFASFLQLFICGLLIVSVISSLLDNAFAQGNRAMFRDGQRIELRSWKGDYLHRPNSERGVTTWNTGEGNIWTLNFAGNSNEGPAYTLKSWKGDYLHRPNSASGVTTWYRGKGNQWIFKFGNKLSSGFREVTLKSWKGDYLHRPDSASGVTTWNAGDGNIWLARLVQ
jgi:hypothetical protein